MGLVSGLFCASTISYRWGLHVERQYEVSLWSLSSCYRLVGFSSWVNVQLSGDHSLSIEMHAVSFIPVTRAGWGKVLGTFSSPATSPSLSALTMVSFWLFNVLYFFLFRFTSQWFTAESLLYLRSLIHVKCLSLEKSQCASCKTCSVGFTLSK